MEFYPPELVTPPLALVALFGCPKLHAEVGEFLRSQHKPPINSLGVGEPWAAARLFGERKATLTAPSDRTGILKVNWFLKHREERPAVAVLFLERSAVVGDPKSWAASCSAMEAVRSAAKARNARVLVAVVGSNADIPEERSGAISRIAAIDKKWLLTYVHNDAEVSLRKLGRLLYEAAGQFYLDAARRRLSIHAERRSQTPELNARVAFKAAALAEFRADWATAVKTYQNAYSEVSRVGLGPPLPLQRAYEVAAVAEQVQVKLVTLLLHQQRFQEALQQFRAHMTLFRRPPFTPPPAFAAAHWGWVSRQYSVMGELLSRIDPSLLPLQKDAHPAYFFLCSAQAAIERRRCAQRASEARGGRSPIPLRPSPVPGKFVGQVAILDPPRRLTDEEFLRWLEVIEGSLDHCSLAIEKLTIAQREAGVKGSRQAYFIGRLLAREHLVSGDATTANRLLTLIAGIYRREKWVIPLSGALIELRECTERLNLPHEHILHSLEVSALQGGLSDDMRKEIATAAVDLLLAGPQADADGAAAPTNPYFLAVKPVNYPLLSCLALCAGFTALPAAVGDALGENPETLEAQTFGIALQSGLPVGLPVRSIEVVYVSGTTTSTVTAVPDKAGSRELEPNQWKTWRASLLAAPGITLTVTDVMLHVSQGACIAWHLQHFSGFEMIGESNAQDQDAHLLREATAAFAPGLFEVTLPLLLHPPSIKARGDTFGLVGETLTVHLDIASKAAVEDARIRIQAGFLEGGQPPTLEMSDMHGVKHRGHSRGPSSMDSLHSLVTTHLGPVEIGALELGKPRSVEILVIVTCKGQLELMSSLLCGSVAAAEDVEQPSTSLEIAIEDPFDLSCQLQATPYSASLILPTPSLPTHTSRVTQSSTTATATEILPANEICLLVSNLRVTAPTEVEVSSVSLSPADGINFLEGPSLECSLHPPALLRKGDLYTTVCRMQSISDQRLASLGHMIVAWKRRRKESEAGEIVLTRLPLPAAAFAPAVLQVKVQMPVHAEAGRPFSVVLQLQNQTAHLQQLTIAIGDASGFVIAGSRHESRMVLPYQTAEHALSLVGYSAGLQALPQVRITSLRYNAVVNPLAGHRLLLTPPLPPVVHERKRTEDARTSHSLVAA